MWIAFTELASSLPPFSFTITVSHQIKLFWISMCNDTAEEGKQNRDRSGFENM